MINLNYIKNEKQLSKVYNLCDIVVLSSRLDNLPNIGLEAQSCGKPIVAYDVGGISDIINDGKNGYLIKPFNHKLYARKINNLILGIQTIFYHQVLPLNHFYQNP